MPNPFSKSKMFHRIGHVTNTPPWRILPTPNGLALVTTTGRKSGKRRVRAMRAVRDGNRAYAVSILGDRADWLLNARADPRVTIKFGAKTYRATLRKLNGLDEHARAAEIYRPVAGWFDYFDYANFVWSIPTRSKLLRVHDEWFAEGTPVVFEIES